MCKWTRIGARDWWRRFQQTLTALQPYSAYHPTREVTDWVLALDCLPRRWGRPAGMQEGGVSHFFAFLCFFVHFEFFLKFSKMRILAHFWHLHIFFSAFFCGFWLLFFWWITQFFAFFDIFAHFFAFFEIFEFLKLTFSSQFHTIATFSAIFACFFGNF